MPILTGRVDVTGRHVPRTAEEFAFFAADMAAKNPRGFRQPSARSGTSLVEDAFIAAGQADRSSPAPSDRAIKRAFERKVLIATVEERRRRVDVIRSRGIPISARAAERIPVDRKDILALFDGEMP